MKLERRLIILLLVAAGALWAIRLYTVTRSSDQWDFRTYYAAGEIFSSGGDPYRETVGRMVSGEPVRYPFVYPPLTLYFFLPFTYLSFAQAATVFVCLKGIFLAVLVGIWWRLREYVPHPGRQDLAVLLLVATFGFDGTLLRDFSVGNVSVVEQAFLWAGVLALLEKRYVAFGCLIAAASVFKLSFLVLLGLPWLIDYAGRNNYRISIAWSAAGFAILQAIPFLLHPEIASLYLTQIRSLSDPSATNASMLSLIQHLFIVYGDELPFDRTVASNLLYGVVALIVVLASARTVVRFRKSSSFPSLVVFILTTFAVVLPRMKDYSYILLIAPAVYAAGVILRSSTTVVAFLVLVCVSVFPYQQLASALLLWGLFVMEGRNVQRASRN